MEVIGVAIRLRCLAACLGGSSGFCLILPTVYLLSLGRTCASRVVRLCKLPRPMWWDGVHTSPARLERVARLPGSVGPETCTFVRPLLPALARRIWRICRMVGGCGVTLGAQDEFVWSEKLLFLGNQPCQPDCHAVVCVGESLMRWV